MTSRPLHTAMITARAVSHKPGGTAPSHLSRNAPASDQSPKALAPPTTANENRPMRANLGDRIEVAGHTVGSAARSCVIVEVRGADGAPPYIVHWDGEDTAHDHLYFPGPDAHLVKTK